MRSLGFDSIVYVRFMVSSVVLRMSLLLVFSISK